MSVGQKYDWSRLPPQVMNVGCRVIVVEDKYDCGIGLIEGKNAVLCLFQGHSFVALDELKKLQVQLPVGLEIRVNAKKEDNTSVIPYRATSVWRKQDVEGDQNLNFLPTKPSEKENYYHLVNKLTQKLTPTIINTLLGNSGGHNDRSVRGQSGENRFSSLHQNTDNYDNSSPNRRPANYIPPWQHSDTSDQGHPRAGSSGHHSTGDREGYRGHGGSREGSRGYHGGSGESREGSRGHNGGGGREGSRGHHGGGRRDDSRGHHGGSREGSRGYHGERRSEGSRGYHRGEGSRESSRSVGDRRRSHDVDKKGGLSPWEDSPAGSPSQELSGGRRADYNDRPREPAGNSQRRDGHRDDQRRSNSRTFDRGPDHDRDRRRSREGTAKYRNADHDKSDKYNDYRKEERGDHRRREQRSDHQSDGGSERRGEGNGGFHESQNYKRPEGTDHKARNSNQKYDHTDERNKSRDNVNVQGKGSSSGDDFKSRHGGGRNENQRDNRYGGSSSRQFDQRGSNHQYRSQDNNKYPSQVSQNSIDSDFYKHKEEQNVNHWRDMMQMMNNPGNGIGVPAANQSTGVASRNKAAGDVTENGGSGPSPADSPVYRAESDNEDDASSSSTNARERISQKRPHTPVDEETVKPVPKRRKYCSPERTNEGPVIIKQYPDIPPHHMWKVKLPDDVDAGLFKEVVCGDDGHAVVVEAWNDNYSGVLHCPSNNHRIVFHVNHILEKLPRHQYSPVKESYSALEIKDRFKKGSRLRCYYRNFNCGELKYQATVIWRDGPAPRGFRSEEYFEDLNKIGKSIKDNRPVTSSLFSKVKDGVIQEYISFETGLIRLVDDDQCVALFALDQVWASLKKGKPDFLDKLDTISLMSYLPVGSPVKVTVRSIPHNPFSQLRYQAVLVWKPELGSRLPEQYQNLTSTKQARMDISTYLDEIHDRIKQNLTMGPPQNTKEAFYPVIIPVSLNMLPKDGSAHILEPTTNGHRQKTGLVQITIPQMNDSTAKMTVYAIFHIEDVYNSCGKQFVQANADISVRDLKNAEVDLICRSIATADSFPEMKSLIDRIKPKEDDKMSRIPLLQAVAVFVKGGEGKIKTGPAPLPTFFRQDPIPLNRKQPSAAFYFSVQLKAKLDTKVFEYIFGCDNAMSKLIRPFLRPNLLEKKELAWYGHVLNRLGHIDLLRDIRHDFGYFNPMQMEAVSTGELPKNLRDQTAHVKVLWFDRPSPKYGLVKVDLENVGSTYAFFGKNVISTQQYLSEVSQLYWKNKKYVQVNANLVDPTSKIPYVVTEMWTIGDRNKKFSIEVSDAMTDWNKVVSRMGSDMQTLNFRAYEVVQKKFQAEVERDLEREERISRRFAEGPDLQNQVKEVVQTTWKPSIKDVVCKVERILGANYSIASDYQTINNEEKRFFVLFDLCDVFINNEYAAKTGTKSLKDVLVLGNKVRLNAVHFHTDNSWNLNYIATAVVPGDKDTAPSLPVEAPCFESSADIKPEKIANFQLVSAKIVKKAPPPDTRPVVVKEKVPIHSNNTNSNVNENKFPQSKYGKDNRSAQNSSSNNPNSYGSTRHNAHAVNEANLSKRKDIIKRKPELYEELKAMEIERNGVYIYDCKACGIQGMPIDDAEDHVGTSLHKESKLRRDLQQYKQQQAGNNQSNRPINRNETEGALFLMSHKEIKLQESHHETKMYKCDACNANRMSFASVKKHVLSQAHKKRISSQMDESVISSECKDMRKLIKGSKIVYFCQPCAFQSDDLLKNKDHIKESGHRGKSQNFCHICKLFTQDKKSYENHRFSIAHKKRSNELEDMCLNPAKYKKDKPAPKEKPVEKPSSSEPLESASATAPQAEEDGLTCKYCDFTAKDQQEKDIHKESQSHIRRVFLKTGEMPKGGASAFAPKGVICDGMDELLIIREGKDIEEEADRAKGIRTSDEIKRKREQLLDKIFAHGIFTQLEIKTKVKCNTCSKLLSGKERSLTMQLLKHFLDKPHESKLKIQIKEEDHKNKTRHEIAKEKEEEEKRAEEEDSDDDAQDNAASVDQAASAVNSVIEPEPVKQKLMPDETAPEDEIVAYLKEQDNVCTMMGDQLFSCVSCHTGLKHLLDFYAHFRSEGHCKNTENPLSLPSNREWRQYVDLSDVFEHGEGLFKCLPCNSNLLISEELDLHLSLAEHMYRNIDESKDFRICSLLPVKPPICTTDNCHTCLATDLDLKIHDRYKHKKVQEFSSDEIENLNTLSQARNLEMDTDMNNVRGRILQLLPGDGNIGLIQLPQSDKQYINVLFDISTLVMPDKKETLVESVCVGYPVLINCVQMEPKSPGYSANINYYASCVTIGDEDEHSAMPKTYERMFESMRRTITEAQKLSQAALKVQLQIHADGRPTPLFHTYADTLENEACIVVMKNQSCMLVKSLNSNIHAVQVLESMLITDNNHETSTETFEVGQTLFVNGLLVDPNLPTQYLVTGCWTNNPMPIIPRDKLALKAVLMFQSIVKSYCMEPDLIPFLDMSQLLIPGEYSSMGLDDIAADDTGNVSALGDIAAAGDNNIAVENDDAPNDKDDPIPFKRIKLVKPARSDESK